MVGNAFEGVEERGGGGGNDVRARLGFLQLINLIFLYEAHSIMIYSPGGCV